jgi:hypothetical protein
MSHHTVPVHAEEETPATGKRLRGGEASRRAFEDLLGLADAPEDWRVRLVVWYDDHVQLLLGPAAGTPRLVMTLSALEPGGKAWVAAGPVAVSYKGALSVPEEIDARVRLHAPERLAGLDVDGLLALLESDPECRPLPVVARYLGQTVTNLLTSWAGKDAYAEFFAVGEIQRGQLDSVDLSGSFRFVQHCDNECLQVSPHGVAPLISAVEYPWDNRTRSFGLPRDASRVDPGVDGMVTTELTEQDVIMGNPKRVRDVLDHVMATGDRQSEKITFFSNTCVPMVTGEDVESVVKQYARTSESPLVYLTVTPISMFNVFKDLLQTRRLAAEAAAGPPDPASVNLVGFADDSVSEDLRVLLAAAGIRVNTHLIPDFSAERIRALAGAPVNVMYPNRVWANHYQHLTGETRIRCITPGAPFGWEGTRQWLLEVADVLGRRAEAEVAWETVSAPHREAWQRACAAAAGHRVALVLRAEETELLTDPSNTWGIPLLRVLEEAGFGIDVFVKAGERKKARDTAEAVQALFRDPSRHVLQAFNTFDLMRKRLRESSAEAVLSYHFFDWRVSEAGKNRFSLQVFEMGLTGAVRSVERLAGICRTPFYRRYRDWLARGTDGMLLRERPGRSDADE